MVTRRHRQVMVKSTPLTRREHYSTLAGRAGLPRHVLWKRSARLQICTHARPLAEQLCRSPGHQTRTQSQPARHWRTARGHGTMPCPERGKRHGSRMALSFLLSPCILPSTQKIRSHAFSIQTAGAAQKQEQWEEGLAKTSSHTQALLMQLRYLAGVETWPAGILPGSNAQTHHSAGVQPGDHSWQTGQSEMLVACTVLLLFLYLALKVGLAGLARPRLVFHSLTVCPVWRKWLQPDLRLSSSSSSSCIAATYPHIPLLPRLLLETLTLDHTHGPTFTSLCHGQLTDLTDVAIASSVLQICGQSGRQFVSSLLVIWSSALSSICCCGLWPEAPR